MPAQAGVDPDQSDGHLSEQVCGTIHRFLNWLISEGPRSELLERTRLRDLSARLIRTRQTRRSRRAPSQAVRLPLRIDPAELQMNRPEQTCRRPWPGERPNRDDCSRTKFLAQQIGELGRLPSRFDEFPASVDIFQHLVRQLLHGVHDLCPFVNSIHFDHIANAVRATQRASITIS